MAEDDGQERTEEPTGKRLDQALDDGNVLTSKDLLLAVVMLGGGLQLSIGGHYYFTSLLGAFRSGIDISDILQRDVPLLTVLGTRFYDMLVPLSIFSTPLVILLFVAQIAFGGFHFMIQNIAFKASRMSLISGLSKIFGVGALIELGQSIVKLAIVGAFGVYYLNSRIAEIMVLNSLPFEAAMSQAGSIVISTLLVLIFGAVLIAAIDMFIKWNKHNASLKMTKQEVRDEAKESDGNPEIKQKIRRMQREAADRGSIANISQAQVIITNPTHFAIGLRYDFEKGSAPKVVVKGTDQVAKSIRELAAEKKLPVLEYPLLARALYFTSEIGSEIHAELYRAVATVLSFVFHAGAEGEKPEIEVPEELRFDGNGRSLEKNNV
ncbi:MAG: flagellar type III secretion system protein FlhB [Beijerinckiaceae bacterium]|nr:flagellar type III secretion system protein FlhB [Beijerinckiaceae bacterium]